MDTVESLRRVISHATGSTLVLDVPLTASLDDVVTSSLQFVILLAEIERVFDIIVPDVDLGAEKFANLVSIARMIEQLQASRASSVPAQ